MSIVAVRMGRMPPALKRCLLLVLLLPLAACATLPEGSERDPRDPFERFNRSVYVVNDALDVAIAKPVAKGYVKVTPQPIRTGVANFFTNLAYPATVVNSLLQGKFRQFANDTGRLVVNTTIGIGGLFDPATQMGLNLNNEDFGQTLGRWGIPAGPYLMRPIFGPSTVRDFSGDIADTWFDPKTYVQSTALRLGLVVQELVHDRAELLAAESVQESAFDPYSFIRGAYLQRREYLVKDGAVETEDVEIAIEEEMPADADTPENDQAPAPAAPSQ